MRMGLNALEEIIACPPIHRAEASVALTTVRTIEEPTSRVMMKAGKSSSILRTSPISWSLPLRVCGEKNSIGGQMRLMRPNSITARRSESLTVSAMSWLTSSVVTPKRLWMRDSSSWSF